MSTSLPLVQLALLGEAVTTAEDVAVFVWDDDRTYIAVNEGACRLLGLPREEILGMGVGALTPDRAEPHFHDVQHRPVTTGDSSFTRPDGTTVDLDWVTFRTTLAGLPYMVSVCWERR